MKKLGACVVAGLGMVILASSLPEDAPLGIVRYTITARDAQGRTGEFKPFEVQASQITIVE